MKIPGSAQPPDLPAFHLDEVHRMQSQLLVNIQHLLGPCMHDFAIEPARFVDGTTANATRFQDRITIELERSAATDWVYCAAILGHELVHAWDGLLATPSCLEEGVACAFGIGQAAAWFDHVPSELAKGSYQQTLKLVAAVPDLFGVVRSLRRKGIHLSNIKPWQLIAASPAVGQPLATALCARFELPKVVGHSESRDYGRLDR